MGGNQYDLQPLIIRKSLLSPRLSADWPHAESDDVMDYMSSQIMYR